MVVMPPSLGADDDKVLCVYVKDSILYMYFVILQGIVFVGFKDLSI
jgi:hypothetical protein